MLLITNFSSFCIHWFYLRETHTGLISSKGNSGWVASCFFSCRTVETEVSWDNTWYWTPGMTKPPGHTAISSSSKFFSPYLYSAVGRGNSSFSLCSSHQLQFLPLILPFLQVGDSKAHSQAQDKVYWPITRQKHNSGELGERFFSSATETALLENKSNSFQAFEGKQKRWKRRRDNTLRKRVIWGHGQEDRSAGCLWVKIRGVTIKEVLVVGVCYGRPDVETDKIFFKQLIEDWQWQPWLHWWDYPKECEEGE